MAIRQKTLLAIATTLIGLNAVLYAVSSTFVLRSAKNAEEQYMQRSVKEALSILNQYQKVFVERWSDWGIWDDSYQYLQNRNPCLLYTSPSPRDTERSRMPSSA